MRRVTAFAVFLGAMMLFANTVCAESSRYIVKLSENNGGISLFEALPGEPIGKNTGWYVVDNEQELDELIRTGRVETVEEDMAVELFETEQEQNYNNFQTNLSMINAPRAWELGCYGSGIRIAVIDSGAAQHDDLKNNLLEGYNYLEKNTDVTDNMGHGTFVSGIIAAENNTIGIIGLANKAKIIPLKCFDSGVTTNTSTIANAIYGAVNDFECDIINASFGSGYSSVLKEAVDYAVSKGVIIAAAVGNSENNDRYGLRYPAAFDNVIGVGSLDADKNLSDYSQINSSVFVTVQGREVYGLSVDGGYCTGSGTSFSTPVVSALAAAVMNADPDIDVEKMKDILAETSEDLGAAGYDTSFGYGLVNVENFFEKLLEDTKVFVSPVDMTENGARVKIFNNTAVEVPCVSIMAEYNDGVSEEISVQPFTIQPKMIAEAEHEGEFGSGMRHFLWDGLGTMRTLSSIYDNTQ